MLVKLSNFCSVQSIRSRSICGLYYRLIHEWPPVYSEDDVAYSQKKIETSLKLLKGGSVELKMDEQSGVSYIKLNNPTKKNAFSGKMMCDLRTILEKLGSWETGKAVILYGADHNFCSGADLSSFKYLLTPEDGEKMCMYMQNTLTELQRLPLITVAFIEGKALGGGAELATACDFRLMTEAAEISFLHKRMGLIPGWGGLTRLIQIIGKQKALCLLASSCNIDSYQALNINLADKVVGLSPKDVFREIDLRYKNSSDAESHPLYTPDCSVRNALDWLNDTFTLPDTDPSVFQTLKLSLIACSESASLTASLRTEKEFFKSLWGADAHLKALKTVSQHINKKLD